jgi:hypothetical protein
MWTRRDAEALALDHAHCRAICDEIGERLRQVLKPEALDIPQRLLALLERLAELQQAPSIVPSNDEMSFPRSPESSTRTRRSADPMVPSTDRKLASAGS